MTAVNGKIAQKIEGYLITMERLCKDIRDTSTGSFEGTMNAAKVQATKDKLTVIESRLDELHALMQDACASSSDSDVQPRSGGGGGK